MNTTLLLLLVFALSCFALVNAVPSLSRELINAIKKDDLEEFQRLLGKEEEKEEDVEKVNVKSLCFVDYASETLLHLAAKHGSLKVASKLLKEGAEVNAEDGDKFTPLRYAAQKGHLEVVKLLLDSGAVCNAKDEFAPLYYALFKGHLEIATMLINKNPDSKNYALDLAVHYKHPEIVKLLLDMGADKTSVDKKGLTLLHRSAASGQTEVINHFLGHCDMEACDAFGMTALHWAALKDHSGAINLLLDEGAIIDAKDKDEQTPLHIAAKTSCLEAVKTLLQRGANMNSVDLKGMTPMHHAAMVGCSCVIDLLLSHGAKGNPVDNEGWTPLRHALESKRPFCVLALDSELDPARPEYNASLEYMKVFEKAKRMRDPKMEQF